MKHLHKRKQAKDILAIKKKGKKKAAFLINSQGFFKKKKVNSVS